MFKRRYIPQYILAILLIILVLLEAWTYYLGTTDVTFKRLINKEVYKEIDNITLRRYKDNYYSPHLFKIETNNEIKVIDKLKRDCHLKKIDIQNIPKEAYDTDKEMIDVIKKSPYIYLSKKYNLHKPKEGRMCLVFRDNDYIYLFINGNLE